VAFFDTPLHTVTINVVKNFILLGRALQVNPIKPTLKAPGTMRLKLNCDELLSSFALNFNLRHYS